MTVLNYPSGDLSSSVCELELPGHLAQGMILGESGKANNVYYTQDVDS